MIVDFQINPVRFFLTGFFKPMGFAARHGSAANPIGLFRAYCIEIHFRQTGFPTSILLLVSVSSPVCLSILNITMASLL